MRFNFISETGDGMGIAHRVQEEGNEVRLWIRTKDASSVGDGLVSKVGDVEDLIVGASPQEDVYIFDTSSNGVLAEYLRSKGFPVLGGSIVADRLERDRAFGADAMREYGIKTPKTWTFDSFEKARKFAAKHKERLVYKPSKLLGELSCSHVTSDNEELLEFLQLVDDETDIENPEFDLQEFTPGIALSTEMWFTGEKFVEGLWNHTLERKELMDGNLGPSGGCTGNVVWRCGFCPICNSLRRLETFLREQHYVGMLDLNSIVTESGEIRGLEWTPRFGYDASPTLLWELIPGDVAGFLSDAARGQDNDVELGDETAGCVRITIPPWPTEKHLAPEGLPIRGIDLNGKDAEHVYLYNVKSVGGKLYSAGAWGILLLLTGLGDGVEGCLRKPYRLAESVRVSDRQYRLDLTKEFEGDMAKLESAVRAAIG